MADGERARCCPECGQTGKGPFCLHWDAGVERKVPTVPARSPQDEDHETSDAVRGDLHGTPVEWPERQPTDPATTHQDALAAACGTEADGPARPEQPPPDALGGQPPAEPETP